MADERIIRDFQTVLKLPGGGKFAARVDEKLALALETIAGMAEEGGKATLTLTFDFTQAQERVDIKGTVKLKLPEEKGFPPYTVFAADGGLSLEHPRQFDMFGGPRVVGATA